MQENVLLTPATLVDMLMLKRLELICLFFFQILFENIPNFAVHSPVSHLSSTRERANCRNHCLSSQRQSTIRPEHRQILPFSLRYIKFNVFYIYIYIYFFFLNFSFTEQFLDPEEEQMKAGISSIFESSTTSISDITNVWNLQDLILLIQLAHFRRIIKPTTLLATIRIPRRVRSVARLILFLFLFGFKAVIIAALSHDDRPERIWGGSSADSRKEAQYPAVWGAREEWVSRKWYCIFENDKP